LKWTKNRGTKPEGKKCEQKVSGAGLKTFHMEWEPKKAPKKRGVERKNSWGGCFHEDRCT